MKFFLQDNTADQVDDIIKRLNKLMDGNISSQMKEHGLEYRLNYGASIVWLRNLAKKYAYNNELANRLWYREVRETMILATMIADSDGQAADLVEDWTLTLNSNEIAEQLGGNLLWRLKNLGDISQAWLKSNNKHKNAAAWVAMSVYLQRGNQIQQESIEAYLSAMQSSFASTGKFMLRVQGRFLRQLCRKSDVLLTRVESFITQSATDYPNCAWLVEDVKTEIDFVRGSEM